MNWLKIVNQNSQIFFVLVTGVAFKIQSHFLVNSCHKPEQIHRPSIFIQAVAESLNEPRTANRVTPRKIPGDDGISQQEVRFHLHEKDKRSDSSTQSSKTLSISRNHTTITVERWSQIADMINLRLGRDDYFYSQGVSRRGRNWHRIDEDRPERHPSNHCPWKVLKKRNSFWKNKPTSCHVRVRKIYSGIKIGHWKGSSDAGSRK